MVRTCVIRAQRSSPAQGVISTNAKFSGLSPKSRTGPEQKRSSKWSTKACEGHCSCGVSAHSRSKPLKLLHDQARQSRLASKGTHRPWTCRAQRRSHLPSCRLLECTGKPVVSCRACWATRPLLAEMGGLGAIKTPTSQFRHTKSRYTANQ